MSGSLHGEKQHINPRLMKDAEAAAYLCLSLKDLRGVPFGRVQINGRVRWDRNAIDNELDHMSGISRNLELQQPDSPDAALERHINNQRASPRRS
jgi:hypothetical protein